MPIVNNLGYQDAEKKNGAPLSFNPPKLINIGNYIQYNCKNGYALLNDTDYQSEASQWVQVMCNETGGFNYPDPWPTCEITINCTDPGITDYLLASEYDPLRTNHTYKAKIKYNCKDKRKYTKVGDLGTLEPHIISQCKWRKKYDILAESIICEIHHCAHPHDDDGAHPAPGPEYNISLVVNQEVSDSHVPFQ